MAEVQGCAPPLSPGWEGCTWSRGPQSAAPQHRGRFAASLSSRCGSSTGQILPLVMLWPLGAPSRCLSAVNNPADLRLLGERSGAHEGPLPAPSAPAAAPVVECPLHGAVSVSLGRGHDSGTNWNVREVPGRKELQRRSLVSELLASEASALWVFKFYFPYWTEAQRARHPVFLSSSVPLTGTAHSGYFTEGTDRPHHHLQLVWWGQAEGSPRSLTPPAGHCQLWSLVPSRLRDNTVLS